MDRCGPVSSLGGSGGSYGRWGQSAFHYRVTDAVDVMCWRDACAEPESFDLFRRRGWMVVRNLIPETERDEILAMWSGDCYPQATETSEGLARCAIGYNRLKSFGSFFSNASNFLHRVQTVHDIGKHLRLMHDDRTVRKVNVHKTRRFQWHVDNSGSDGHHNFHWLFVMLQRNVSGANLCLASLSSVDCFDSPTARTSGTWNADVLESTKCCPHLYPGDGVFYTEDVAHRTEEFDANGLRFALSVQIETDPPLFDGRKEVRCASWREHCHANRSFMDCVCPEECDHPHDEL